MKDVNVFYRDIGNLNEKAEEMLMFDDDPKLPNNAFVFAERQGEQFLFFRVLAKSSDPPIYVYEEEAESFEKAFDSIWDLVEEEIDLPF